MDDEFGALRRVEQGERATGGLGCPGGVEGLRLRDRQPPKNLRPFVAALGRHQLQGVAKQPDGLAVSVVAAGGLGGMQAVDDAAFGSRQRPGPQVLLRDGSVIGGLFAFEDVGGTAVQAGSPVGIDRVSQRVADDRVRERVGGADIRRASQESCRQGLVHRVECARLGQFRHRAHRGQAQVAGKHRGGLQQRSRCRCQPSDACPHRLADGGRNAQRGHARVTEPPSVASDEFAVLDQTSGYFADVERISRRVLVHRADDRPRHLVRPGWLARPGWLVATGTPGAGTPGAGMPGAGLAERPGQVAPHAGRVESAQPQVEIAVDADEGAEQGNERSVAGNTANARHRRIGVPIRADQYNAGSHRSRRDVAVKLEAVRRRPVQVVYHHDGPRTGPGPGPGGGKGLVG